MEGRLSRGLVQVENARDALRDHVSEARRTTERLLRSAETADAEEEREPRLAVADLN
jgi:vacuolar-type H+-ATPase subunit H